MIKINKEDRPHVIGFSIFAILLLCWFAYAGLTGLQLFNNEAKRENWKSSGPGYHK